MAKSPRFQVCISFCFLSLINVPCAAQTPDSTASQPLQELVIKAFAQGKRLQDLPAAVNYIGSSTLSRFNPASIVQAINTTPGVRMEERSPGSYRFNIRGSSLRSPFGVRNVKVYCNDIPITDPGGNTYLNQLGFYNFNSIEIIKGPGSSLYGAGTGGVLLIESGSPNEQPSVSAGITAGSYNSQTIYGNIATGSNNNTNKIMVQHQQSDGYRVHSQQKRDVYSWDGHYRLGDGRELKTTFLYGNLFYQTPGALTKAEYLAHPQAARPASGAFLGAEGANASITQKTFIAGASYTQPVMTSIKNTSVFYGMFTELRNPAIQNYGHNSEPHVGARSDFQWNKTVPNGRLLLDAGGELQQGFANFTVFKNVGGNADSLRTYDEINNRQALLFSQLTWDIKDWTFTLGSSLNFLHVGLQRFAPASLGKQSRTYTNQVAPRFAAMKKFGVFNLYGSIAKGFSPPTTAEVAPTGGTVNLDLNAEQGINYDLGFKGTIAHKIYVDVNAFVYALNDAIVQRRTAGGSDYYMNAGSTKQHGIETAISYPLFQNRPGVERGQLWLSHTWHNFHYNSFKQLANDYSGKQLPSEAPHAISAGYDFASKRGWLATINYYFCDKIPLNDANTDYAASYHLVGLKFGYQKWIKEKLKMVLLVGGDNLLDQKYSLGNDINGFGGRYYNAAARRNFYVSLNLQWLTHHK